MKFKLLVFLCLIVTAATWTGCSNNVLSNVGYEYDRDYDLEAYQTFAIIEPDMVGEWSAIARKRVLEEVARQLEDKGFERQTDMSDADFWVTVHATSKTVIDTYDYGMYGAYGYRRGGWYGAGMYPYGGTQIESYEEGTVFLDIVDTQAKELVWRGKGSRRISSGNQPASDEQLQQGVAELIANFPPPPPEEK